MHRKLHCAQVLHAIHRGQGRTHANATERVKDEDGKISPSGVREITGIEHRAPSLGFDRSSPRTSSSAFVVRCLQFVTGTPVQVKPSTLLREIQTVLGTHDGAGGYPAPVDPTTQHIRLGDLLDQLEWSSLVSQTESIYNPSSRERTAGTNRASYLIRWRWFLESCPLILYRIPLTQLHFTYTTTRVSWYTRNLIIQLKYSSDRFNMLTIGRGLNGPFSRRFVSIGTSSLSRRIFIKGLPSGITAEAVTSFLS